MAVDIFRPAREVEASNITITHDHWRAINKIDLRKKLPKFTADKVSALVKNAHILEPLNLHWGCFLGSRDWSRIATMSPIIKQEVPSRIPFSNKTRSANVNVDNPLFQEMRAFAEVAARETFTLQDHLAYAKGGKGPTIPGQRTAIYLEWQHFEDDEGELQGAWRGDLIEMYDDGRNVHWLHTGIPIPDEVTAQEIRARFLLDYKEVADPIHTNLSVLRERMETRIVEDPDDARARLREYWERESNFAAPQLTSPFFGISELPIQLLDASQ